MNASRALSPPLASSPSSTANATKQATINPIVTYGVRCVGLASRSGITRAPGQGFLVGFAVARTGPEGLAPGLAPALAPGLASGPDEPGTAVSTAWLMPSLEAQNSVGGSFSVPGTM